jgi:hypothetical protein
MASTASLCAWRVLLKLAALLRALEAWFARFLAACASGSQ